MPLVTAPALQVQADGTEAALLISAATAGDHLPGPCPLGLELRRVPAAGQTWLFTLPGATLVLVGVEHSVTVLAREPQSERREHSLGPGECYVAPPGTVVQLCNHGSQASAVYLLTAPGRLVELEGKRVTHDDTVVVGRDWSDDSLVPDRDEVMAERAAALRRLGARRGQVPAALDAPVCVDRASGAISADSAAPLVSSERAAMEQHELAPAQCSRALCHRTVEQLWHVLEGGGELWRSQGGEARVDRLGVGSSVCIQPGVQFQLRAGPGRLRLLVFTSPRWPGPQEAVPVRGPW